jgi:glutamyl-tRNA reductase
MLTRERVRPASEGRSLVLVDLAVPRDIEPGVADLPGCHLYDLDDLESIVAEARAGREGELQEAKRLVAGAVREFAQWQRSLAAVPAVRALREHADRIRSTELRRVETKLAHLAPEDFRRIEQLTRSIVNKLLHQPSTRLREAAVSEPAADDLVLWRAARELFDLDTTSTLQ